MNNDATDMVDALGSLISRNPVHMVPLHKCSLEYLSAAAAALGQYVHPTASLETLRFSLKIRATAEG